MRSQKDNTRIEHVQYTDRMCAMRESRGPGGIKDLLRASDRHSH